MPTWRARPCSLPSGRPAPATNLLHWARMRPSPHDTVDTTGGLGETADGGLLDRCRHGPRWRAGRESPAVTDRERAGHVARCVRGDRCAGEPHRVEPPVRGAVRVVARRG